MQPTIKTTISWAQGPKVISLKDPTIKPSELRISKSKVEEISKLTGQKEHGKKERKQTNLLNIR